MVNVLGEFVLSVCAAQMSGKKLLRYKHEGRAVKEKDTANHLLGARLT